MGKLRELIQSRENEFLKFHPTKEFYTSIGINKKRFGLLLRDEKPMNVSEIQSLSKYFNTEASSLI